MCTGLHTVYIFSHTGYFTNSFLVPRLLNVLTADSTTPFGNLILIIFNSVFTEWTPEVRDGALDMLWHAGNENKLRYDVFL